MTARTNSAGARRPAARAATIARVQLKKRDKEAEAQAREPLFSVDGIDYTMPIVVPFGDALNIAAILRLQPNEDVRGMTLIRNLCGDQAMEAILRDATITRGEWNAIVQIASDRVFGALEPEDDQGN